MILTGAGYFIYHMFKYRTEISLAKDFLVTDQWQTIDVKDLLPPLSKDRNDLYLAVPPSYKAWDPAPRGIEAPDGTIIKPEIEVVDSNGVIYVFKQTGAARSRYEKATYAASPELAKETQITRIRIRANHSILIPAIIWSSYDIKDLP